MVSDRDSPLVEDQVDDHAEEILAPQAMTRFADPEEIAAAAEWLCCEQASFFTGVALAVDVGAAA
jgi:NAD(P)-dependent dehydrogenase (short-subunit alcohol dehydrogenase family)